MGKNVSGSPWLSNSTNAEIPYIKRVVVQSALRTQGYCEPTDTEGQLAQAGHRVNAATREYKDINYYRKQKESYNMYCGIQNAPL